MMGNASFSGEFKRDAVRQIAERGYPVAEDSQRLGVSQHSHIAEHRPVFSVRIMCRCLAVQPSGFYAWLKAPLSRWGQEGKRQAKQVVDNTLDHQFDVEASDKARVTDITYIRYP